ncbi:MAG: DUF2085 domain-containing protein [Candidatus Ranarchaeia archaeon]
MVKKLKDSPENPESQRRTENREDDFLEVPNWFFMLSHHGLSELDHCFCISRGEGKLPIAFCARCTGALVGFFISLFFFRWFLVSPEIYLDIIGYLFPLPAIIDWGSQSTTPRTSRNAIRFPTGILYGFAIFPTINYLSMRLIHFSISFLKPLFAFILYFGLVWIIGRKKLERIDRLRGDPTIRN